MTSQNIVFKRCFFKRYLCSTGTSGVKKCFPFSILDFLEQVKINREMMRQIAERADIKPKNFLTFGFSTSSSGPRAKILSKIGRIFGYNSYFLRAEKVLEAEELLQKLIDKRKKIDVVAIQVLIIPQFLKLLEKEKLFKAFSDKIVILTGSSYLPDRLAIEMRKLFEAYGISVDIFEIYSCAEMNVIAWRSVFPQREHYLIGVKHFDAYVKIGDEYLKFKDAVGQKGIFAVSKEWRCFKLEKYCLGDMIKVVSEDEFDWLARCDYGSKRTVEVYGKKFEVFPSGYIRFWDIELFEQELRDIIMDEFIVAISRDMTKISIITKEKRVTFKDVLQKKIESELLPDDFFEKIEDLSTVNPHIVESISKNFSKCPPIITVPTDFFEVLKGENR